MSFSERMGIVPKREIQIEGIDSALRSRIANCVSELFTDEQAKFVLDLMGKRTYTNTDNFIVFDTKKENLEILISVLEKEAWYRLYDAIQYGYEYHEENCFGCDEKCSEVYFDGEDEPDVCAYYDRMQFYTERFNEIFEREKSGYRIVGGEVVKMTSEEELSCVEEAISSPFDSVNTHIKKALQLYGDRLKPDYENSIKESISAVEAMCCIITGTTGAQATLGNMLKKLEDSGIKIHSAMKNAFSQLYGYTSDSDGIRHGGIDFTNAPAEDAKYMLIACSAFVNYLIEKYSRLSASE